MSEQHERWWYWLTLALALAIIAVSVHAAWMAVHPAPWDQRHAQ